MKILFFARSFYPNIGGVEKHVLEISKRLVKMGHQVTVVSESTKKNTNIKNIYGIKILKINVGKNEKKKKIIIWKWLWKNRNLIKNADIVHCHDVFYWFLPFKFMYPQKPIFTTFHGYESYPIRKSAILVRKISEKLSWGNICIGDFISKWYGTKPNYVSYGAVEIEKNNERNIKHKESGVFFGRLDEQTGVLTYSKAIQKLKQKYPKFKFLVIGDGKYKKLLSKTNKVVGFKKNPEKYFSDYRFAFVSRYLSILEAFASKRMVFAVYDNPVKEDYLKMAPFSKFIIIAKDADDLCKKINFVLNYPKLEKEYIEKAYTWVKEQTWEVMIKKYLDLWKFV